MKPRPDPNLPGKNTQKQHIAAVSALAKDRDNRVLLVKRKKAPNAGKWSLPGGKRRPNENIPAACLRELQEETGYEGTFQRIVGRTFVPSKTHAYVISVCQVSIKGGTLGSGSDALDARWFSKKQLTTLPLTDGLLELLMGNLQ